MKETMFSLKKRLGVNVPDQIMVRGFEEPNEQVPKMEPHEFDLETLRDLYNWWMSDTADGLFLFGPHGCGKTSTPLQFFARLNVPVYEKTVHKEMRFEELVGHYYLVQGNTFFNYGPLCRAMGAEDMPGVLLINEIDRAKPGVLTGLYEVMQGSSLDVMGRETLQPKPGFRVIATANTGMLLGDTTGVYQGAQRQSAAFVDRFWQVKCTYPKPEVELKLLAEKVPELPEPIAKKMVEVANNVRAGFVGVSSSADAREVTISTRALIRWAKMSVIFKDAEVRGVNPILYSLDRAVLNVASEETREAIRQVVHASFDIKTGGAKGAARS
jgi:cobaltochelatase CobS